MTKTDKNAHPYEAYVLLREKTQYIREQKGEQYTQMMDKLRAREDTLFV